MKSENSDAIGGDSSLDYLLLLAGGGGGGHDRERPTRERGFVERDSEM